MRDEIRLDDIRTNRPDYADYVAVLKLSTSGWRGTLDSHATVDWVKDGVSGHTQDLDYSKRVHTTPCARATQKAIAAQHAIAFAPTSVEAIIAEVRAHYKKLSAEEDAAFAAMIRAFVRDNPPAPPPPLPWGLDQQLNVLCREIAAVAKEKTSLLMMREAGRYDPDLYESIIQKSFAYAYRTTRLPPNVGLRHVKNLETLRHIKRVIENISEIPHV
jgi:hypothetical protein